MGEDPGKIRQEIAQTRADIGETLEAVAERSDVKERAKESVSSKVGSAKEKASGTASRVSSIGQQNPLGLVIGGAALGFLAGLVAPSSGLEQEKLGPVAQEFKGQAKKTGQEALERGKHIAEEAAHSAAETAKEQGGREAKELADHAKQSGREVASKARS